MYIYLFIYIQCYTVLINAHEHIIYYTLASACCCPVHATEGGPGLPHVKPRLGPSGAFTRGTHLGKDSGVHQDLTSIITGSHHHVDFLGLSCVEK